MEVDNPDSDVVHTVRNLVVVDSLEPAVKRIVVDRLEEEDRLEAGIVVDYRNSNLWKPY